MSSGALAGHDELDAIAERDVVMRDAYALATYADRHVSLGNLVEARTTRIAPCRSRARPHGGRSRRDNARRWNVRRPR